MLLLYRFKSFIKLKSHSATMVPLAASQLQYISKIMPMMSSFVRPITIPMPCPSALLV